MRRLAVLLYVVVTGIVVSGWASNRTGASGGGMPVRPETFAEPPEITSQRGVLSATLTA